MKLETKLQKCEGETNIVMTTSRTFDILAIKNQKYVVLISRDN